MGALIDWLEFLVRVGLGIGLVASCATNAKRVGGGAWLVASLGAINVFLSLAFRVVSFMNLESSPIVALRITDAGFTVISALLVFVGFILLR